MWVICRTIGLANDNIEMYKTQLARKEGEVSASSRKYLDWYEWYRCEEYKGDSDKWEREVVSLP